MKHKACLVSALSLSLLLSGCGDSEPYTQAEMLRMQQQQELQAQRQAQQIQLERERLQNDLMRQQLQQQSGQMVQQPVQGVPPGQVVVQDNGVGVGTALVGAAAAGAVGYMAGSASSNKQYTTNRSYNNYNSNKPSSYNYNSKPKAAVIAKPTVARAYKPTTYKPATRAKTTSYSRRSSRR